MNESTVSQKFTKIHLVKMVECITGLSLRDAIDITEKHLGLETLLSDMDFVRRGREQMQDDLLDKMLSARNNKEIDKQIKITQIVINNLEVELDRLRELRCCKQN